MSIVAHDDIADLAVPTVPVAVAAEDADLRVRIAGPLAARAEYEVRTGDQPQALLAPDCDLLVCYQTTPASAKLTRFSDLKREFKDLRVVLVCDAVSPRDAQRAVEATIEGLLTCDQLDSALVATVNAVLVGQSVVPADVRRSMWRPSLSFREKQVLGMVVMGSTNAEIGSRLFLAESTVKSHLSSAFNKLGVRSRSEAADAILDPNGSMGSGILAITGSEWNPPSA